MPDRNINEQVPHPHSAECPHVKPCFMLSRAEGFHEGVSADMRPSLLDTLGQTVRNVFKSPVACRSARAAGCMVFVWTQLFPTGLSCFRRNILAPELFTGRCCTESPHQDLCEFLVIVMRPLQTCWRHQRLASCWAARTQQAGAAAAVCLLEQCCGLLVCANFEED